MLDVLAQHNFPTHGPGLEGILGVAAVLAIIGVIAWMVDKANPKKKS